MAMWRNKALLTVGAYAGVAVALYYAVEQISKFLHDDDDDDDDEVDSGNQTPMSVQCSVMEHSLEVKDTEATSPSLALKNTEATPPSLGVMDAGATPPSQEVMDAEATPPSQGVMDAEASPHPTKVKATEVTPPSLNVMTSDVMPTSVDTPSSTDLMDKEVMPTSMELTPSSLVNLPGVLCELEDNFTELHKHYEVSETIGSGAFGTVRLGIHILTGENVAIKILEKKDVSDALWNEIDAMMDLHHQWTYDNNTAAYLLLVAKKQRITSAAPNTPDVAAQNSTFSPVDNTHVPLNKCNTW